MQTPCHRTDRHPVVIAIPVRDEAERIGPCVAALVDQIGARPDHIVLLVNNTSDGTVAAARRVPMPAGTTLHIVQRFLAPEQANAGYARHLAMREAAALAGPDGLLLTTDADGIADPDWLAANIAAISDGADAVAGWVDLDPVDWSRIPLKLHEDDARECAYDDLCDEIHARLDPDPHDPMPRHTQASGASIAVTAAAFHTVGGIPPVPAGEDRAFLAALRRADARIRHSLACHVTVSGRIVGRADGGMADTIRRRLAMPDVYLDDRLEPARDCARRAGLRRMARQCFRDSGGRRALARATRINPDMLDALFEHETFGAAWTAIESASPVLRHRLVAVSDLAEQMAEAEAIRARIRAEHAEVSMLVPGGAA